jgi:hypothetical protein
MRIRTAEQTQNRTHAASECCESETCHLLRRRHIACPHARGVEFTAALAVPTVSVIAPPQEVALRTSHVATISRCIPIACVITQLHCSALLRPACACERDTRRNGEVGGWEKGGQAVWVNCSISVARWTPLLHGARSCGILPVSAGPLCPLGTAGGRGQQPPGNTAGGRAGIQTLLTHPARAATPPLRPPFALLLLLLLLLRGLTARSENSKKQKAKKQTNREGSRGGGRRRGNRTMGCARELLARLPACTCRGYAHDPISPLSCALLRCRQPPSWRTVRSSPHPPPARRRHPCQRRRLRMPRPL